MIRDSLQEQLTTALKNKNDARASVIRMLLSVLHNKEIELHGKGVHLEERDVMEVLKKELKKRTEAALAFGQAGRKEMADAESAEANYIQTLLPPQLSEADIEKIVDEVFLEHGSVTQQDFGKVMKAVLARTEGKADGGVVSGIIKKRLS